MATVHDGGTPGKSEAKKRAQAREREDDGEARCVYVSPKFVKRSNLRKRIRDTNNNRVDMSERSIGASWRKMGIVFTLLVISVLNNELSTFSPPSSLPSLVSSSASPVPLSFSDDTIEKSLIPQPSLSQFPARLERQLTKASSSESQHPQIQSSPNRSAPATSSQLPKSFSIADIQLIARSINPAVTATSPSSASGSALSFVAESSSTSRSLPLSSTSQSISSSMFNTSNTLLASSFSSQQQPGASLADLSFFSHQQPDASLAASSLSSQQQPSASLAASSLSSQQQPGTPPADLSFFSHQQPGAPLATYSVSSVSGQSKDVSSAVFPPTTKDVSSAVFPPTTILLPRGTMRSNSPSKLLIIQHLHHQNHAKANIPVTAKDNSSPLSNVSVALLEGAAKVIQKNSEATKNLAIDNAQECSCEFAGLCLSKGSCVYVASGLAAVSIFVVFIIGWFLQFIVTIPSEWISKKKPVKLDSIIIADPLSNGTENVAFLPSDVESVTDNDGRIVSV